MDCKITNEGLEIDFMVGDQAAFSESALVVLAKYATKAKSVHACKRAIQSLYQGEPLPVREVMRQVNGSKKCHVVKAAKLLGMEVKQLETSRFFVVEGKQDV